MSEYHLLLADVRVKSPLGRTWEVGDVAAQFICHSWAVTPHFIDLSEAQQDVYSTLL